MSQHPKQNENIQKTPIKYSSSALIKSNTITISSQQKKSQKSSPDPIDLTSRSSDDQHSGQKFQNTTHKLSDMLDQNSNGSANSSNHDFQNWEYGKSPKYKLRNEQNYDNEKSLQKIQVFSTKLTPNKNTQFQQQNKQKKQNPSNQKNKQPKTPQNDQQQLQNETSIQINSTNIKSPQPISPLLPTTNQSQNRSPPTPQIKNNNQQQLANISIKSDQKKQKQLYIKYQKQLSDDMAQLKSNFNLQKHKSKHQKDKLKQSPKIKLNKTLTTNLPSTTPSKHFQFQQSPQIKAMQRTMLTKMAQQKKKQNYLRLKQWDKRRAQSLALHRIMIQTLQTQIDKRIKSSIENMDIYATFFREKIKQQQRSIAYPIINTKYALQNNSISKNVYINCTVILNTLSDQNTQKCKRINNFIQLIKNNILRDSIQTHLQQSQKQLLRVRQMISTLKHSLRKYNTETQQKTNQLVLFFNQNSFKIDNEKDFYCTQLQFLQKAHQQTIIQKKLGQYCYQYLQIAITQQIKRNKIIRESMIIFSKALQQCYGMQIDQLQIQQLSTNDQNQLIQQFYSLQQIFDQRSRSVFNNHLNLNQQQKISNQSFLQYIKKFDFQPYDSRVLLLKQYQVKYHPTSKNQSPKQQTCYLVITVDKSILLFLSKQKSDPYSNPDIHLKTVQKNLQIKLIKDQYLDMIIKNQKRSSMISYFWESKHDQIVYHLQFYKKDNRDQFFDYLQKIKG